MRSARTGVAEAVRALHASRPDIRIHLVGHSLGGRLMAGCAKALSEAPKLQIDSLMLLEAAFSHFGFSSDNGHGTAGFFRDVIAKQVVKGPFVSTFSAQDTVVGQAYSIMSRLAGDNTREIGDASDEFGGIGRNGPLKTAEVANFPLNAPGIALRVQGRRHQQPRRIRRADQGPRRRDERRRHVRVRVGCGAHLMPQLRLGDGMTEASDPVTVALTGHLPFYLLLAAVLTWPIATGLLRLYTRAVRRSMRMPTPATISGIATPPFETARTPARHGGIVRHVARSSRRVDQPRRRHAADASDRTIPARGPCLRDWRQRLCTGDGRAHLLATGMEILPVRFLFLFWVFVWPVVLTLAIVAVATRGARFALTAAYFIGLSALGAVGMQSSPDLTWGQSLPAVDLVRPATNDSADDVPVAQGPCGGPARSDVHVPRADGHRCRCVDRRQSGQLHAHDCQPGRLGRPRWDGRLCCVACCRVPGVCGCWMGSARVDRTPVSGQENQ